MAILRSAPLGLILSTRSVNVEPVRKHKLQGVPGSHLVNQVDGQ